jgi:hypothetical protein
MGTGKIVLDAMVENDAGTKVTRKEIRIALRCTAKHRNWHEQQVTFRTVKTWSLPDRLNRS